MNVLQTCQVKVFVNFQVAVSSTKSYNLHNILSSHDISMKELVTIPFEYRTYDWTRLQEYAYTFRHKKGVSAYLIVHNLANMEDQNP
jgi:hypothetical protein